MEPFYFGRRQNLFGAFHPAEGIPKQLGVLIAPPLFHEGIRSHFALRQISERCAAAGFDVLRFDYSGQGNSSGQSSDYTIQHWQDDLIAAADELTDISGSQVAHVVAVRFAANLVCALTAAREIERLILWDPLLSGNDWLYHLYEHRAGLRESLREALADTDREFSGHATYANFREDLMSMPDFQPRSGKVSAITSKGYRNTEPLRQIAEDTEHVEFDCGWQNYTSSILYPTEVIQWICRKVT
jgi:pimeloyl-ACP methyl ester carboxylesterase